jgi:hypothetical protein
MDQRRLGGEIMLIKGALTSAAVLALSVSALAGDLTYYPPPPPGSPVYAPTPLAVAGDLSGALGFWLGGKSSGFLDINGRVAFPLQNNFVIEPELGVWTNLNGGGTFINGVVHFYKNRPSGAIGVFAGASDWSGGGSGALSIGGEIKGYLPNADLTGQISWTGGSGSGFVQLGGFGDFYLSPMSKLRGGVQVAFGGGNTWGEADLMYLHRLVTGPSVNLDVFAKGGVWFGGGSSGFVQAGLKGSFGPPAPTVRAQDEQIQFTFRPLWD